MNVHVITVPYDSGKREWRLGCGPQHLLTHGLVDVVRGAGHDVEVHEVRVEEPEVPSDIGMAVAVSRAVAERVRWVCASSAFPLVLAGNCSTAAGTLAGLGSNETGVLWFDSHGDLNTPETTTSGFLDGMALSMVLGRCWVSLLESIPGWAPVSEARVATVALRDLDAPEEMFLRQSGMTVVDPQATRGGPSPQVRASLEGATAGAIQLYAHVDLDVLDPAVARVNEYQAPNGITVDDVVASVRASAARCPLAAVALTACDPAVDHDGRAARAAAHIAVGVLALVLQ